MTSKQTISALLIVKNEAEMIENCLRTLNWCDEIIVVDDNSEDETATIAQKYATKVVSFSSESFSQLREKALSLAQSDWVFYVDADERVTPQLAEEIQNQVQTQEATVYSVQRRNICYGTELTAGGWQDDWVERVFSKHNLKGWYGKVHESPKYTGQLSKLHNQLIHLTHRNTVSGLIKTSQWTPIEAHALYAANIPQVSFLTLLRKGFMEFFRRVIIKKGYRDGNPGLIEATVQAINKVLIYIQVWELQQNPSLSNQYAKHEQAIQDDWQKYQSKKE